MLYSISEKGCTSSYIYRISLWDLHLDVQVKWFLLGNYMIL